MSDRLVRYEDGGEDRWAIWSTIVEDFIWYDMTEEELIDHYGEKAREEAEERTRERIDRLESGEDLYRGWQPPEEEIDELRDDDDE